MIRELVYTSAPKGLKPGSQGFCTVAATKGMPDLVRERVEGLSGYRVAFPSHSAQAGLNPVAWSHLAGNLGEGRQHLLSRVGYAGLDFEGRINKIAHHLLLAPADFPPGGPAWLMLQPGVMRPDWDGRVGWLPPDRPLPRGDSSPRRCSAWERACGDPGWAGVLVESFLNDPAQPAYLEFPPGRDLLPLLAEAIALLPADRRWDVTFSTYFTGLPPDVSCLWRGVLRDSPEALRARLSPGTLVIPVVPGVSAPAASALGYIHFARTGIPPSRPSSSLQAVARSESPHAEWGLSADPGLGGPLAPYEVVDDDEPERGRKASPYRRDPRKPPPLFRQVGNERARRWPIVFAALLVLLAGTGGWWWLREREKPRLSMESRGDGSETTRVDEKKDVPPRAASDADDAAEGGVMDLPNEVGSGSVVESVKSEVGTKTDKVDVEAEKKQSTVEPGTPAANAKENVGVSVCYMGLRGIKKEDLVGGVTGSIVKSVPHGIAGLDGIDFEIDLHSWDKRLEVDFVGEWQGIEKGFVVPVGNSELFSNSNKRDDREGRKGIVFRISGPNLIFEANRGVLVENNELFNQVRSCCLIVWKKREGGRANRAMLGVVWLGEPEEDYEINVDEFDVEKTIRNSLVNLGGGRLVIERDRTATQLLSPLSLGVRVPDVMMSRNRFFGIGRGASGLVPEGGVLTRSRNGGVLRIERGVMSRSFSKISYRNKIKTKIYRIYFEVDCNLFGVQVPRRASFCSVVWFREREAKKAAR